MATMLLPLLSTCLLGIVFSQDADSVPANVQPDLVNHGDVQILYTDDFMKVIEKYGITDDDIMYVTNKFKEGRPPTVKKTIKNIDTGEEEAVEVNLKNFIAGGHVTDLSPIMESTVVSDDQKTETESRTTETETTNKETLPNLAVLMSTAAPEDKITTQAPEVSKTTATEAPPTPTIEEIVDKLRVREQDLLIKLEKNRREYEQIAQALMEVRRDIALTVPDEYDVMSVAPTDTAKGFGIKTRETTPKLDDDVQNTPDVGIAAENPVPSLRELRLRALRQALLRDAYRKYMIRRRLAAVTGFTPTLTREFFVTPTRTPRFIPVRRIALPFLVRMNRRQIPQSPLRSLPVVVDRRNPEIQTRPFEPIPRVTNIVVDVPEDDANGDDTTT